MKKILALLLVLAMVLSLAACTGKKEETAKTSIAVCLASEPDTIDPALNSAVDGATLIAHLFSGLAKWSQDSSGKLVIVPDAATELVKGVENADGTVTYTYTLRDGLKWSDGKDVTANDFEFAWKRAASEELGADYGYMFEVVDGYNEGNLNVKALDAKTLQVTLYNAVAYWDELLAFPTYFPVREDVVANESWATDPSTYVCNGAYTMTGWEHNSVITLEKNANYIDADKILMDKIEFYLSDDANNMVANFKNGTWQLIDDVPTNEMATLKAEYPDEYIVAGQIGTYYVCWNINEDILPADSGLTGVEAEMARAEIRNAISLLFDRNYIVNDIAQGGQVPASSFVAMGMTNPDGTEFYKTAGHNDGFIGYYNVDASAVESNYNQALEVLKKYYTFEDGKFTNFPSMTYLYNTSEGHKAIGEYLQAQLAAVGITMNMENQEWATFLQTRKNGDYSIARTSRPVRTAITPSRVTAGSRTTMTRSASSTCGPRFPATTTYSSARATTSMSPATIWTSPTSAMTSRLRTAPGRRPTTSSSRRSRTAPTTTSVMSSCTAQRTCLCPPAASARSTTTPIRT